MSKIIYRTILVAGDNHDKTVKKYSADTPNNKNAFYQYERCQQHRLEVTGEEGDFSDPFPLKNGGKSYSAHISEIDWDTLHMNPDKMEFYGKVWDMVKNDSLPANAYEEHIRDIMKERTTYFENFGSKEEYVNHNCSFWYWGFATEDCYTEVDEDKAKEWVSEFYDKFIMPNKWEDPLLTIYEVKALV